jgi:YD repeat-containing protein
LKIMKSILLLSESLKMNLIKGNHIYMKKNKLLFIAFGVIFRLASAYSQEHDPVNFNITPPSPNTLSAIKFGDIPVSIYTGIPRIEIPIYECSGKYINLPIMLKYHSGGVRVEEIAPSVGLGWTLSAGGSVSRTIRGLADDMATYGYLECGDIIPCESDELTIFHPNTKCNRYYSGREDGEQDIYHVNVNNLSFNFTISKEGAIEKDPQSKIKVEKVTGTFPYDSYGNINEWKITDENGVKYYFNVKEYTKLTSTNSYYQPLSPKYVVTTWYLQKIEAPFSFEILEFEYEQYTYNYLLSISESFNPEIGYNFTNSTINLIAQRIKKIITQNSIITFNYDNSGYRKDLYGDKVLTNIIVNNSAATEIKRIDFTYLYMLNTGFSAYSSCTSGDNQLDKRIVLSQIKESGKNPYKFTYKDGLPARDSKSQDHWGFYNGQPNVTLLPKTYFTSYCDNTDQYFVIGDANRRPDPELAKCGILTKIEYPTGGYTSFEYELNKSTNKFLDYNYKDTTCLLDGISSTNVQIKINREQLPYTYLSFNLINLPPECIDLACGIRAIIKLNNVELYSINFTKADYINNNRTKVIETNLANGTYQFTFQYLRPDLCPNISEDPFLLKLSYMNESSDNNKNAGGIRIKKIIDTPNSVTNNTEIIKWYEYTYINGKSSGYILHPPVYLTMYPKMGNYGPNCYFGSLRSTSCAALGNTQGSPVGYSRVLEHFGANSDIGTIEYWFTSPHDYPDLYGYSSISKFPYVPPSSFENCRGLLFKKLTCDKNNVIIEKLVNTYDISYTWNDNVPNIKVAEDESWVGEGEILTGEIYSNYQIKANLVSTRKVNFFAPNDSIVTVIDNTYSPEYNKITSKKTSYLSDGKIDLEKYYYPQDFTRGSISPVDNLFNINNFSEPIIQETWRGTDVNSLSLIGSTVNVYKDSLNGKVFLNEVYSLMTARPLTKTEILEFNPSVLLRKPEYYHRELKIFSHDLNNNILEYSRNNNLRTSLIWGYKNTLNNRLTLPVVKIEGISYTDIPYSIKTNISGRVYTNSLNITNIKTDVDFLKTQLATILSDTRYILTFYTYFPLIGMTSQTDTNGKTTYYEYDSFGRLTKIFDQDQKIIQEYKHHYKE